MLLHSRGERRAEHAPTATHTTAACTHFQSYQSCRTIIGHRICAADHPGVSRFRSLVSRLGQPGSAIDSRSAYREREEGVLCWLGLGDHLLLWNLLVAHLSDDSLCRVSRAPGLCTAAASDNLCGAVSRPGVRGPLSFDSSSSSDRYSVGAVSLGFMRMAALRSHRTSVECSRLFASVSSIDDSVREMGRSLSGRIRDPAGEYRCCLFTDSPSDPRSCPLRRSLCDVAGNAVAFSI